MATVYDTINKMYNGQNVEWKKITDNEKSSAYFLLNRCMSMLNPVISAELSKIKISPSGVMEHWQNVLEKQYYKSPSCFYQVNPKKKKEEKIKKSKKFIPKNETIKFYCETYNIDTETYKETEKRYETQLYEELKEIEKELK